ncbi:EAL domain-containing protein [Bacillus suaedaesalsae]|uniref:EAL domain-containing protein n=1 Tax=Bacillus suaedaesalsae TaxID=2810349 RepID=A0ABS2DGP1_9BACI|nr:EAL-associated domain-containing protein [Bacillus suaedaesalsae]MBM6617628.1 EAL domain-containing protein [Bacillus suaedaesalsae]
MDPLDVLTNLSMVAPHFQAIFTADERKVCGYEVLGRYQVGNKFMSLGPFFSDESVPDEYRAEVDDLVVKKAIEYWLEREVTPQLFINRNPNLLMRDNGESLLELLLGYEEKGFSLSKLVLEIREHDFVGDIEQLNHLLTYYRTFGIKVAVDNVGNGTSNLDRIGLLAPDFLKFDLHMLRKSNVHTSHQDVLYSLSLLARKIGAAMLYENIETLYQLQYAWRNGGRYYQGYYLQNPTSEFVQEEILTEQLKAEIQQFIEHEKRKIQNIYQLREHIQNLVQELLVKYKKLFTGDELLEVVSHHLTDFTFRIYICDEDGFQQSANHVKTSNGWELQLEYYNKNWSFRPYFLENIMKMKLEQRGILSDLYSDIETGEVIRTFSFPINQKNYLFIDLTYDFLYEKSALY